MKTELDSVITKLTKPPQEIPAPEPVQEIITLEDGLPIPSTWAELVPHLERYGKLPLPTDAGELKIFHARHKAIKKAAFGSQQAGPAAPEVTADQMAEVQSRRVNGLPARRDRRQLLETFIQSTPPPAGKPAEVDLKGDVKERLLKEPGVLARVWKCRQLLARHELLEIDNFDLTSPATRIAEIDHAIQKADSLSVVRELVHERVLMGGEVCRRNVSKVAQHELAQAFQPVQTELNDLISFCRATLESWQAEAEKQEDAWFKKSNLPPTRTALSRRFTEAASALPTASKNCLHYFGVHDVA